MSGDWWVGRGFAVVLVDEEGLICVRISRAVCCRIDVISEFTVSAKDCGDIFLPRSLAYNF